MDGKTNAIVKSGPTIYTLSEEQTYFRTNTGTDGTPYSISGLVKLNSRTNSFGYTGVKNCIFAGILVRAYRDNNYTGGQSGYNWYGSMITDKIMSYVSSIFTEDVVKQLENGYYRFDFISNPGNFLSYIMVQISGGEMKYSSSKVCAEYNTGYTSHYLMSISKV